MSPTKTAHRHHFVKWGDIVQAIADWFENNWPLLNGTVLLVIAVVCMIWLTVRKRSK